MSIQSEIDRLAGIKADLKAALAEKGGTGGGGVSAYPAAGRGGGGGPVGASIVIKNNSPCDLRFFDEFIVRAGYQGYESPGGRFSSLFSQFSIYNMTGNALISVYFDYAGDGHEMTIDIE